MAPLSLAVRITLPFSDVSGIVRAWALKADKILCYEHIGEETNKPHIHLLMIRVAVDQERLKQIAKTIRECGSGNEFWSFKTKTRKIPVSDENSSRYIVYMSKGRYDPVYNKGYEEGFIESCKNQWEEKPEEIHRDNKIYESFCDDIHQMWIEVPHIFEHMNQHRVLPSYVEVLASRARSWAFKLHNNIWSVRTATDAKMVFLTYCMRNGYVIPDKIKVW